MSEAIYRDAFCSYCGTVHTSVKYPKMCEFCNNVTYLNAPAVGVGLVTLNDGLLVVQRAIPPHIGGWALPSGYKELHETWEAGIAREVFAVDADTIILAGDRSETRSVRNANNGSVLIFGLCAPIVVPEPVQFKMDFENSAAKIITSPIDLCFPHHQELADWYFGHMSKDLKGD